MSDRDGGRGGGRHPELTERSRGTAAEDHPVESEGLSETFDECAELATPQGKPSRILGGLRRERQLSGVDIERRRQTKSRESLISHRPISDRSLPEPGDVDALVRLEEGAAVEKRRTQTGA